MSHYSESSQRSGKISSCALTLPERPKTSVITNVAKKVIKAFIRSYQLILSAVLPPRCRFYPSCSQYGLEAIELHGALRGSGLLVRRLCKCHPFHPGGYDPVPLACPIANKVIS